MKILEINTEKTWRGGERQTLFTVKGLLSSGVSAELLCLKNYPLSKKAKQLNAPVHEVKNNISAALFLMKHGSRFDVIHAQTAKAQSIAVLTKIFHKKPVVYTRRVDFRPTGSLAKLKYKKTDRVVAISSAIKEVLEKLGVANVDVIPSVIEAINLDGVRARKLKDELLIENKKIIATAAALVAHKDPLTMVEVVRELSTKRDDFVFLHFGDGILRNEVTAKIAEYKLQNIYKLMGFYEGVEDFFSIFDVFVMSSEEEGLGSSVLDAFIYKVPVVSTNAGGLKETVTERGLLCQVKDAKCLANSISNILKDDVLRSQLVSKAYDDVKKKYSLKDNIEKYIKIFKNLPSQY